MQFLISNCYNPPIKLPDSSSWCYYYGGAVFRSGSGTVTVTQPVQVTVTVAVEVEVKGSGSV